MSAASVRLVRTGYSRARQAATYGSPDGRWEITPTVIGFGRGRRAWRLRDTTGRARLRQLSQQAMRMQARLQACERLADRWERTDLGASESMFGAIAGEATLKQCARELRAVLTEEEGK